MATAQGYKSTFLGRRLPVPMPVLSPEQQRDLAKPADSESAVLDYVHYSVVMSASRRFPYFTATNIDGNSFRKIDRDDLFPSGNDEWRLDDRIPRHQWGMELYDAERSDFHRGHMTKREDPQWGRSLRTALQGARSTFHFTNCAPQIRELNARSWLSLESYILTEAADINRKRICVFTGPVLDPRDPVFATPVKGEQVRIPVLFWKVVYFSVDGSSLKRVGFLMGQGKLLFERGIARRTRDAVLYAPLRTRSQYYTDFKDAETYQVNLATIEQVTGLTFTAAIEPYVDNRPAQLILKEVEITARTRSAIPGVTGKTLTYEGLSL